MIINTPVPNYDNFYDVARFNLTWNLTLILSIFLPILITVLLSLNLNAAYPTFVAFAVSLGALFVLKKTGEYRLTAKIYSISGLIINQFSLLFLTKSLHFADPIWMVITLLFTYFTLGKVWGNICLALDVICGIIFILFFFNDHLQSLGRINFENVVALAINFMICSVILALLITQFLKLNRYAENKYITLTDALQDKNNEKSVLLKEVHHRVKNNLQVIISLLRLQAANEENPSSFSETVNRIRSMSLIHEKMYQTNDFANIDLEEYLETLITDIIDASSVDSKIKFDIRSQVNTIKMKSLVPVALIFNELISNSIKHAFQNKSGGKISVDITTKNDQINVIYSDNGEWQTPAKKNTLGLELINSLTEQLTGSFEIDKTNGTKYLFHFVFD